MVADTEVDAAAVADTERDTGTELGAELERVEVRAPDRELEPENVEDRKLEDERAREGEMEEPVDGAAGAVELEARADESDAVEDFVTELEPREEEEELWPAVDPLVASATVADIDIDIDEVAPELTEERLETAEREETDGGRLLGITVIADDIGVLETEIPLELETVDVPFAEELEFPGPDCPDPPDELSGAAPIDAADAN